MESFVNNIETPAHSTIDPVLLAVLRVLVLTLSYTACQVISVMPAVYCCIFTFLYTSVKLFWIYGPGCHPCYPQKNDHDKVPHGWVVFVWQYFATLVELFTVIHLVRQWKADDWNLLAAHNEAREEHHAPPPSGHVTPSTDITALRLQSPATAPLLSGMSGLDFMQAPPPTAGRPHTEAKLSILPNDKKKYQLSNKLVNECPPFPPIHLRHPAFDKAHSRAPPRDGQALGRRHL